MDFSPTGIGRVTRGSIQRDRTKSRVGIRPLWRANGSLVRDASRGRNVSFHQRHAPPNCRDYPFSLPFPLYSCNVKKIREPAPSGPHRTQPSSRFFFFFFFENQMFKLDLSLRATPKTAPSSHSRKPGLFPSLAFTRFRSGWGSTTRVCLAAFTPPSQP